MNIIKKEVIVNSEYQYDLEIKDEVYSLYYSNAEFWSHPGELIISLVDTGNEYKMVKPLRAKGCIGYDEANELYILLNAVKDSKIEIVEVKREI